MVLCADVSRRFMMVKQIIFGRKINGRTTLGWLLILINSSVDVTCPEAALSWSVGCEGLGRGRLHCEAAQRLGVSHPLCPGHTRGGYHYSQCWAGSCALFFFTTRSSLFQLACTWWVTDDQMVHWRATITVYSIPTCLVCLIKLQCWLKTGWFGTG